MYVIPKELADINEALSPRHFDAGWGEDDDGAGGAKAVGGDETSGRRQVCHETGREGTPLTPPLPSAGIEVYGVGVNKCVCFLS